MAAKSVTLSNAVLNLVLKATAYVPTGATVFVALLNAGTETTGGTGPYARQQVIFGTAAAAGSISSTTAQTFTGMPAVVVNQIALYDAVSGGVQLYLTSVTSKTTNAGDTVSIAVGAITATEN